MAKAATKKTTKITKAAKPKKAPASKALRAALGKLDKAATGSVTKEVAAKPKVRLKKTRAARAPVISKDELRNQLEKVTTANATLKTKHRETAKLLKAAEARIAVLEHQIGQAHAKAIIEAKPVEKVKLPRKTHTRRLMDEPEPKAERDEEAGESPELETV